MDQLRARLKQYIQDNYKTQAAFARSVKMSPAHVSGVLSGRKAVPLAWAELVGASFEVRVTIKDWTQRMGRQSPVPTRSMKCLACGEYHYGIAGLPCPTMMPVAYGFDDGVVDHD